MELKIIQDEHDIMFQEEVYLYLDRNQTFTLHKNKVYKIILSYCNTDMRSHIEGNPDDDTWVKNDPIITLEDINKKMYDPQHCEYEY